MKRTELYYSVSDEENEQLVIEPYSGGIIIQTSGAVALSNEETTQLRDQLTLILETED